MCMNTLAISMLSLLSIQHTLINMKTKIVSFVYNCSDFIKALCSENMF